LGGTLLLQGSGGLATLLAALWIGRTLGPAQQGQFNQIKSLIDLGAALAALGMPQALYVFTQSGRMDLRYARWLSAGVALLGLPAGLVLALWNGFGDDWRVLLGLAVSVALACLYSQWRTLTLLLDASWRFNLVTVVPQLLLLPLAFGVVRSGGASAGAVAQAMALVWLLATLYVLREFRRIPMTRQAGALSFGALFRHGLSTWAVVCLMALAIVMLQKTALSFGGPDALGRVSLALLLAQAPLTPLNYALPLLVRYRLRQDQNRDVPGSAFRFTRYMPLVAAPMLLLVIPVLVVGQFRDDLWLGQGYAGLHRALAWMLVAGAAEAMMRVVSVDTQAEGRPWRSACAEGVRVIALAAFGVWGSSVAGPSAGQAAATGLTFFWAMATWAAALTLWALNRKDQK
jgi:O-antigen/teichoic acid export membrane protein